MNSIAAGFLLKGLLFNPFAIPAVQAGPIDEVLFHSGAPDVGDIERWSNLPTPGDFLIDLKDVGTNDLVRLQALQRFSRLRLELHQYPSAQIEQPLAALAEAGAELIAYHCGFPSGDQIERLNRIAFKKIVIVANAYPSMEAAARLALVRSSLSITFDHNRYPLYTERALMKSIPAHIPVLLIVDSWPRYSQMDVMNLLPHRFKLRVVNSYPSISSFDYLLNIKRLDEVTVYSDFPPASGDLWNRFGALPVTWSVKNIPTEKSLAAFEASLSETAPRALTLDQDENLSVTVRNRLEASPLRIQWIHDEAF